MLNFDETRDQQRGISMLSWLGGRGEMARRVEAEADRLVRDYGEQAYSVARLREDEASSVQMAQEWNHIARAVACNGRRLGSPRQTVIKPSASLA
jgi:hypothetical protein